MEFLHTKTHNLIYLAIEVFSNAAPFIMNEIEARFTIVLYEPVKLKSYLSAANKVTYRVVTNLSILNLLSFSGKWDWNDKRMQIMSRMLDLKRPYKKMDCS